MDFKFNMVTMWACGGSMNTGRLSLGPDPDPKQTAHHDD